MTISKEEALLIIVIALVGVSYSWYLGQSEGTDRLISTGVVAVGALLGALIGFLLLRRGGYR